MKSLLPLLGTLFISSSPLWSQDLSALKALDKAAIRAQVDLQFAVEILGTDGQPNPKSWRVIFHDPKSSTQVHIMTVAKGEVDDEEEGDNNYLEGKPPLFFARDRVKIDHQAAFEIVDREATAAKVGFDSIDYQLRAREFSTEPIWTLRLVNEKSQLVGTVELSADSGKLLRTVWIKRNAATNTTVITDSALTGKISPLEPDREVRKPDPDPPPPTVPIDPEPGVPPDLPPPGPKLD